MTLLALCVVGGTIMLMLSYDPAEAATTFTVTENGDEADINITNSRCDSSTDTGDQCTLPGRYRGGQRHCRGRLHRLRHRRYCFGQDHLA